MWQGRGEKEADRLLLIQTEHKIPAQLRKRRSGGREESLPCWVYGDGAMSGYHIVVKPGEAAASKTKPSLLFG